MKYHSLLESKSFKKHQQKINAAVHELNKAIKNDDLWMGRFFARQAPIAPYFEVFPDGSGAIMHVYIDMYDCEDKTFVRFRGDSYEIVSFGHMYWAMNKFITEYSSAWKDGKHPYKDKKDYRNVDRDKIVKESKMLFQCPQAMR